MRWNFRAKFIIIFFVCLTLLTWFIFSVFVITGKTLHDNNCENSIKKVNIYSHNTGQFDHTWEEIDCVFDGWKRVGCVRNAEDVFVPFEGYLRKQFDISGRLDKDRKTMKYQFEWWTSYAKLWRFPNRTASGVYDPNGPFGRFGSYNVENRDRVRCISGLGVPMSTQWSLQPYFYPTQVAQFALQHYSRNVTDKTIERRVVLGNSINSWIISPDYARDSKITEKYDPAIKENVIHVISDPILDNPGIFVHLYSDSSLHVLQLRWMATADSSLTVIVEIKETKEFIRLNYVHSDDTRCVWEESEQSFTYAIGTSAISNWTTVIRDIFVDLGRATQKAGRLWSAKKSNKGHLQNDEVRLVSIGFRGKVKISKWIMQRSSAHMDQFLIGADWLLSMQNDRGGWAVPVTRKVGNSPLLLQSGWHSAMAQGHAISVLTRAYNVTGVRKYLLAAQKALQPFQVDAARGGVRNYIFDFVWYEEYPTTPGSFVLNGFMYSLIGLYDLSQIRDETDYQGKAFRLYKEGISSLKKILPLFDTGSGTIYDLRHYSLRTAPNLARWDYHAVHIYLLFWLSNIENDPLFSETAERWIGYARGRKTKKN